MSENLEHIKFPLGRLVCTPAALHAMGASAVNPITIVERHLRGDWGNLDAGDKRANDLAVDHGNRLLSVYKFPDVTIWIITEADRSVTTILLPEDY